MEVMIGCIVHQRQGFWWRPRQIIPAVALGAIVKLIDLKHEESEDVHLVEDEN